MSYKLIVAILCSLLISLLAVDFFLIGELTQVLELLTNLTLVVLSFLTGNFFSAVKNANKKPALINEEKLAIKVAEDEKHQLKEKIKTLEAALERALN